MFGTRTFFLLVLVFALVLLIIVPVIGGAYSTRTIPANVSDGFGIWRSRDCAGCHTINGQGGAYAPDLTRIYNARGEPYLREFLVNPGAFHPNTIRTMPRPGLTLDETDHLLIFLKWVGEQDGAFPPRPINISGGLPAEIEVVASESIVQDVPADPVTAGYYWFSRPPANCATCHSLEPDVVIVGPSLAGVATRAATHVAGQSAEQYLRSSILDPSAYVVTGFPDAMARNLGQVLNDQQIGDIIAFLLTQVDAE